MRPTALNGLFVVTVCIICALLYTLLPPPWSKVVLIAYIVFFGVDIVVFYFRVTRGDLR